MSKGIALITGAGNRLGADFARGLARAGYDIGVHYNGSAQGAEAVAADARQCGVRAALLPADLSQLSGIEAVLPACIDALGTPDILINNASPYERDDATRPEAALWDLHGRVIAQAPAWLGAALYGAVPDGRQATIINILDQKLADRLTPDYFSYTAAKAALQAVTEMQARAFAPKLRVNAVSPGLTLRSGTMTDADFERLHDRTPLQRGSRPSDLIEAILYLIGAPAVSGQTLIVDGGESLK